MRKKKNYMKKIRSNVAKLQKENKDKKNEIIDFFIVFLLY
jgi:hypothetical protein